MRTPVILRWSARAVTSFGPQSDVARLAVAAASLVVYVGLFVALYHLAGLDVLELTPALVLAVSWLLGFWPGVITAALSFPLNGLLLLALGEAPLPILERPGTLQSAVLVLVLGAVLGGLRDVAEQIRREIEARKREERARRETEERYRIVAESASEAIFTIDDAGVVRYANPAARSIFGYEIEEMVGRPLRSLLPDMAGDGSTPGGLLSEGRGAAELTGLHRSGQRIPVELSFGEFAVDGAHGYTGIVRDISDRKRVQEALTQAKEAAETANHAKSDFLSRMSHELRTPLNGILGFGQLLEMDPLPVEQRESVEQILKAGRHLLDLINEVLDIARIEAGRISLSPEPVRLDELVQEACDLVRPLVQQRSLVLDISAATAVPHHVIADRQRLKQVLLNLLSNAVKYNRDGGRITLVAAVASEMLELTVADTGIGIPAERLDDLFTPFERLGADDTPVEGTGLGLALSRRLVEAMGGRIQVRSRVGVGSEFTISFVLTDDPDQRLDALELTESAEERVVAGGPGRTILYVEDNISNFKLMERILAGRPGVRLLAAMQGHLGLELAGQHHPDLILLDLDLPDMHGSDVLEALRQDPALRHIPVVVISADATPGQIQRLLQGGARDYLTKPLDVKRFLEVLDAMLLQQQEA